MATSDEFTGDLSLWTEIDPNSKGTFSIATGQLELAHASGTDTDMWTDRQNAPRLFQTVTTPLDISVKLNSLPGEDGACGLFVTNAARTNLVRLDYYTDGGVTNLFFAHAVAGSGNSIIKNGVQSGNPLYLRIVMPDSDSAEGFHSADGETWTSLGIANLTTHGALVAAEAGPYGSTAFSPFPARTFLYEYVRFDLAPGGGGADQDLNVGFHSQINQIFAPGIANQSSLNLSASFIPATTQIFVPSVARQSNLDLNVSFKSSSSTVFQCTINNEGDELFEPTLLGNGSLADRIMAGLIDQGFLFGSLVDREYTRLLNKLGLAYTGAQTIQDLYFLADEDNRVAGLVT